MTKYYIRTFLLMLATILYSSVYAASDTAFPVTVEDDRKQKVTFTQAPQSVASISAFGADLLTALGKKATGISTLNHKRPAFLGDQIKHMTDLGETHVTNMELLTQLDPDLIIGIRSYTEPFAKKFEEIGQFLAYDLVTYDDSFNAIESAASAMGEKQQATKLNRAFAEKLKAYHEKSPGGLTAVFLWHWADVPYGYFNQHLTMHIIKQLKVKNLIGDNPNPDIKKMDSAPVSMETLLKLNPDVILSFKGEHGPILNHPVWSKLKAVKNRRIYRVSDQYITSHGPVARDMVLRELAYLFYPKHFSKPDDIPIAARAKAATFTQ